MIEKITNLGIMGNKPWVYLSLILIILFSIEKTARLKVTGNHLDRNCFYLESV